MDLLEDRLQVHGAVHGIVQDEHDLGREPQTDGAADRGTNDLFLFFEQGQRLFLACVIAKYAHKDARLPKVRCHPHFGDGHEPELFHAEAALKQLPDLLLDNGGNAFRPK